MAERRRYLEPQIRQDLARKMVFVAGPRQVGKTTVAKRLLGRDGAYLNWDIAEHREKILAGELPTASLWAFDEIHRYRKWRQFLKGAFDGRRKDQQILVTGSARLDFYRYGGDSLQGRYHLLRLHPFTVAELGVSSPADFHQLLALGGFPEPFLVGSEREARRWSREYRNRLVREEISTLERVQDLGSVELLLMRLPKLVGSTLSVNALREDLQVSHKTLSKWLAVLERLYALFLLAPFGSPQIRAIRKARKHYHLDWSLVLDQPQRFENLVAAHLLKWTHWQQDSEGREAELRYFRDNDGREVDFVVTENGEPTLLVECKWGDSGVSPSLRYLSGKFPGAAAWQISAVGVKDFVSKDGIRVAPAIELLGELV